MKSFEHFFLSEQIKLEILKIRLEVFKELEAECLFSTEWLLKNVLSLSDEEAALNMVRRNEL